jgi:phosphomevalonate kinase
MFPALFCASNECSRRDVCSQNTASSTLKIKLCKMGRNRKSAEARSRKRLKDNTVRRELHETERLDSDVRDHENAVRRELHRVPDVRDLENAARRELHETERLDSDVRDHENAVRQELHRVPDVRDLENAARRELHETERLDSDVRDHENTTRRSATTICQDIISVATMSGLSLRTGVAKRNYQNLILSNRVDVVIEGLAMRRRV